MKRERYLHERVSTGVLGAVMLAMALLLAACGSDGGGPAGPSKTFTYTITHAGGELQVGRRVVVINGAVQGTCTSPLGITSLQHSGDAPVTTPGIVDLTFTLGFTGPYVESIYIDVDASNTLTSGDLVWGTNPLDLAGLCIPSMDDWPAGQSFDWVNDVAVLLGSTTYTGPAQPFSLQDGAPASGNLQRFLPVEAGGY